MNIVASKNRDTFFVLESFWLVVILTFDVMVYHRWTKLAKPPVIIVFEKLVCNDSVILKNLRVKFIIESWVSVIEHHSSQDETMVTINSPEK